MSLGKAGGLEPLTGLARGLNGKDERETRAGEKERGEDAERRGARQRRARTLSLYHVFGGGVGQGPAPSGIAWAPDGAEERSGTNWATESEAQYARGYVMQKRRLYPNRLRRGRWLAYRDRLW